MDTRAYEDTGSVAAVPMPLSDTELEEHEAACIAKRVADCPICNAVAKQAGVPRAHRRLAEMELGRPGKRYFMVFLCDGFNNALYAHAMRIVRDARARGAIDEVTATIRRLMKLTGMSDTSDGINREYCPDFTYTPTLDERLAMTLFSLLEKQICLSGGGSVNERATHVLHCSVLKTLPILFLILLTLEQQRQDRLQNSPPPDISPTVVLLIVAAILAPRAPQRCPSVA